MGTGAPLLNTTCYVPALIGHTIQTLSKCARPMIPGEAGRRERVVGQRWQGAAVGGRGGAERKHSPGAKNIRKQE